MVPPINLKPIKRRQQIITYSAILIRRGVILRPDETLYLLNELDEKARFTGQIVLTLAWEQGTMLEYIAGCIRQDQKSETLLIT
jgi:hypothetical protein